MKRRVKGKKRRMDPNTGFIFKGGAYNNPDNWMKSTPEQMDIESNMANPRKKTTGHKRKPPAPIKTPRKPGY